MSRHRPTLRYRPAWRTAVGETRTVKEIGHVEMTADGFERRTIEGFQRVGQRSSSHNQQPIAPSDDAQFFAFLAFFGLMLAALAACGALA